MADDAPTNDDSEPQTLPENVRSVRDYALDSHDFLCDWAEKLRARDLRRMTPEALFASQQELQTVLDATIRRLMFVAHWADHFSEELED